MYNPEELKNLFTLATFSILGQEKRPVAYVKQECASFPGLRRHFQKLHKFADPDFLAITKEVGKDPQIQFIGDETKLNDLRLSVSGTLIKVYRFPRTAENIERLQDDFVTVLEQYFGCSVFGPYGEGTNVNATIKTPDDKISFTGELPYIYLNILHYAKESESLSEFYSGLRTAIQKQKSESTEPALQIGCDVVGFTG